jgi:hypothetical protein
MFTQDQLTSNSKFDRLYLYDHRGRITTALTGAEARGQGPTNHRPYPNRDVNPWEGTECSL